MEKSPGKKSWWEKYKSLKPWLFAGGVAVAGFALTYGVAGAVVGESVAVGEALGIGAINSAEDIFKKV